MNRVYLKNLEEDMYQSYKVSLLAKGNLPLKFEDWKKEFIDRTKPITQDKEIISETRKEIEFYTYEQAAELLHKAIGTIKSYISNNQHGLILLETNKLDKESVDILVAKNDLQHKEWELKQKYEEYVLALFKNNKMPLEFDEWLTYQGKDIDLCQIAKDIDLEMYISFENALNILCITESTLRAYIRNEVFNTLIKGFSGFLLKSDVVDYRKNLSVAIEKKNIEKKKEKEKEERLASIEEKLKNCFVGGYIQCNNAFVKESYITQIVPVHNEIRIMHDNELTTPSFLCDEKGTVIKLKDNLETREMAMYLLKIIEKKKEKRLW